MYRDKDGAERSAGSYATELEAEQVAKAKADWVRDRRGLPDPERVATITVEEFLPIYRRFADLRANTIGPYVSVLNTHVFPRCGTLRMVDVQMATMLVITAEMKDAGCSGLMIKRVRDVFSSYFKVAMQTGYRTSNPFTGLKVGRIAQRGPIPVLTPEQMIALRDELPTRGAQLFASLIMGSGMRLEEALALDVWDIGRDGKVIVNKILAEPGTNYSADGNRWVIEPYTKDGGSRMVWIQETLANDIRDWAEEKGLGPNDLIFPLALVRPERKGPVKNLPKQRQPLTPERLDQIAREMGLYIADNGRTYRHGTLTAYTKKCRCEWCRQAGTEYYNNRKRAQRLESKGLSADTPKKKVNAAPAQPYMGRGEWADIFYPACDRAGITAQAQSQGFPKGPTPYQLRHSHASLLVNNGADPVDVMKRLGHKDLSVTSRYVMLKNTDTKNIGILDGLLKW